ncbi:MAG: hypothetical protein F4X20_04855 [Dehalococcoidia bacterium]|nr:hypothetical protein [Dehalococcoidia bacterium]
MRNCVTAIFLAWACFTAQHALAQEPDLETTVTWIENFINGHGGGKLNEGAKGELRYSVSSSGTTLTVERVETIHDRYGEWVFKNTYEIELPSLKGVEQLHEDPDYNRSYGCTQTYLEFASAAVKISYDRDDAWEAGRGGREPGRTERKKFFEGVAFCGPEGRTKASKLINAFEHLQSLIGSTAGSRFDEDLFEAD